MPSSPAPSSAYHDAPSGTCRQHRSHFGASLTRLRLSAAEANALYQLSGWVVREHAQEESWWRWSRREPSDPLPSARPC